MFRADFFLLTLVRCTACSCQNPFRQLGIEMILLANSFFIIILFRQFAQRLKNFFQNIAGPFPVLAGQDPFCRKLFGAGLTKPFADPRIVNDANYIYRGFPFATPFT